MPPSTLSVTQLALKGVVDLQAWLDQTNSEDALTAMAVTQVSLGQELSRFLLLIKQDNEASTARVKANNDNLETIRAFWRRLDPTKRTTDLTATEAATVNNIMGPILKDKWTNINPGQQNEGSINSWISSLTANGDQITADSSLNQSTLNASLTRVSAAFDLVTSIIKKWSDIQNATTGNIRN